MEKQLICISRQYGSGGREIGEAVAKKLGLPCYDKCLITQAAQKSGLPEGTVAEYDERGEDLGFAISGNHSPTAPHWPKRSIPARRESSTQNGASSWSLRRRAAASSSAAAHQPSCAARGTSALRFYLCRSCRPHQTHCRPERAGRTASHAPGAENRPDAQASLRFLRGHPLG